MCFYLTVACLHCLALLLAYDAQLMQSALGWGEATPPTRKGIWQDHFWLHAATQVGHCVSEWEGHLGTLGTL